MGSCSFQSVLTSVRLPRVRSVAMLGLSQDIFQEGNANVNIKLLGVLQGAPHYRFITQGALQGAPELYVYVGTSFPNLVDAETDAHTRFLQGPRLIGRPEGPKMGSKWVQRTPKKGHPRSISPQDVEPFQGFSWGLCGNTWVRVRTYLRHVCNL